MKATYIGHVKNGVLKIINRKVFDNHILSFEGKDVILTLDKKKKARSNEQNKYWWGVIVSEVKRGLKDAGFQDYRTNESVHELLKYRFLKTDSVSENGEVLERIKSTSELTTSEFMELIAEVQQWASEFLGIYIPDPNENLELEL